MLEEKFLSTIEVIHQMINWQNTESQKHNNTTSVVL